MLTEDTQSSDFPCLDTTVYIDVILSLFFCHLIFIFIKLGSLASSLSHVGGESPFLGYPRITSEEEEEGDDKKQRVHCHWHTHETQTRTFFLCDAIGSLLSLPLVYFISLSFALSPSYAECSAVQFSSVHNPKTTAS